MLFISRYKNFKLTIRPTIKQLVHTSSGGEDVISHKGVVVEFREAIFDTKNWREYGRPESPAHIDVIKSEEDLIRLMKASPWFELDFFERVEETRESKKAKLLADLARIEAEEAADNPDHAPSYDADPLSKEDTGKPDVASLHAPAKAAAARKPAKKGKAKGKSKAPAKKGDSVTDL